MKISNKNSRYYVENKIPFVANNLKGVYLADIYIVYSYNWYPIWMNLDGVWYKTDNGYSVSTKKQISQTTPTDNFIVKDLNKLINK